MEIDLNYEKWIGEKREVTNCTLAEWAHYIKITREKLVDKVDDDRDREFWWLMLRGLETEVKNHMSERPEPNKKDIKEILKRP